MAGDDAPHIGQANARALELLIRVQPLEDPKKLVAIPHVEPRPVIADVNHGFVVGLARTADLDHRRVARAGVFDRVGKQVDQHLEEQGGIRLHRGQRILLP